MKLGSFLLGAIVGTVGGAAITLLSAPKSGEDIRNTIQEQTHITLKTVRDTTSNVVDQGKSSIGKIVDRTKSATN